MRGAAILVLSLLGAKAALAAPASCEGQKIVLDAVPVSVNYRDNTALLRDVVITQCDVRIQANEARVKGGLDFENGQWTISGDVRITAEGGSLRSDKAIVSFRSNVISQASISGAPAEFEQLRADGTTAKGRANSIDYETSSGTVSFNDNAWLSYGCNEITGQRLVYNIKTQSVQGQSQAAQSGSGRIRIEIQPKTAAEIPCAKPESEKKP